MTADINGNLPNDPIFRQLLKVAREVTHVVVHDPSNGVDADYAQLLTDLLCMRGALREFLPHSLFDDRHLLNEDTPYVFVLSNGNYEYIIAALSILSIGGAVVPISTCILPEEALYFMQKCKSSTFLVGREYQDLGNKIHEHSSANGLPSTVLPIEMNASPIIDPKSPLITLTPGMEISPHRPGIVFFTSGTTGPPKGVVHARRMFYEMHRVSGPGHIFLSHHPAFWIGGALPLLRQPLAGARVEVIPSDPVVVWERLRAGGVTLFTGPPHFWTLIMQHFQNHLASLPADKVSAYIRGAQNLQVAYVSGAMPHGPLRRFWREEMGRPLQVSYGATELGDYGLSIHPETDVTLERCVGRPDPNITVRLSDGDHGEMMIKSEALFSGYLADEAATRTVFTEDGFYRTGDLARRVGEDYVLEGRASHEFIRFLGYKVPILEVEMRLLELPFISEGCILSVLDEDNNGLEAALVRLQPGTDQLSLKALREHLAANLPMYMLPAMLRILRDGEEIPRTPSLKVLRRDTVKKYFTRSEKQELPSDVEQWDFQRDRDTLAPRAWDWCGLQE
ncbi:hypothetical protein ASPWEDRAFT_172859 [Aspergillus wentii DTO 134E9]|uniref:AMP-dependent synthetase/ligase domain-containing protein n=1 Tax=Aspergillus wentii DTO 134E9 TaxID=1073089 RepID=A0A1L9RMD6_ASPWE|nr:uncharacterized protein ASPWEDRAFT_172859 [Aspergillus wentii DTO 134E9]OJJ36072.1 hypothetical protein ASPWEDRAFT_172859 [Aspergillus wentii DTO 134E9]